MTKKEINIRKKAYDMFKDNPDYYRIDGAIRTFKIKEAEDSYKEHLAKKRAERKAHTKTATATQISTVDLFFNDSKVKLHTEFDVEKLFTKGYDTIDYEALQNEWTYWNRIALASIKKGMHNKYNANFIIVWLNKYIERNNISIVTEKIIYNDRHYAIRNDKYLDDDGFIYRTLDFIKHSGGRVMKYSLNSGDNSENTLDEKRTGSSYKSIGDLIDMYFYMFTSIGITDNDLMFLHILYMLIKTVDLDSWIYETENNMQGHNYFSPVTLRNYIARFNSYGNSRTVSFKDSKKHRFQKLFLEPGFELEAKRNYLKDRRRSRAHKIMKVVEYMQKSGKDINNINVYNELIHRDSMSIRTFNSIVKEFGIDIGDKMQFEIKIYEKENNVESYDRDDTIYIRNSKRSHAKHNSNVSFTKAELVKKDRKVHKPHKLHKQQKRSEWHEMVRNCAEYSEIVAKYPEVSRAAYRKAKSRINNGK